VLVCAWCGWEGVAARQGRIFGRLEVEGREGLDAEAGLGLEALEVTYRICGSRILINWRCRPMGFGRQPVKERRIDWDGLVVLIEEVLSAASTLDDG
jgi:hypothetical protein